MHTLIVGAVSGVAAGLVASLAMDLYQRAAGPLFAQDESDDDPATVKAADGIEESVAGRPVPKPWRKTAGSMVHYATGTGLGLVYGLLAPVWPPVTLGFGAVFGIAAMLVLDDALVPAFGWGPPPWRTGAATHVYGLTSHLVFGVVLEGVRRLGTALLA